MASAKLTPEQLKKLFSEEREDQNVQDKKIIEVLKKRLNERLTRDPKACQKAALIIESWLHQKPKK